MDFLTGDLLPLPQQLESSETREALSKKSRRFAEAYRSPFPDFCRLFNYRL